MRYDVDVKETRLLRIEVDADSAEDALYLAQGMYGGGGIDLGANSGASVTGEGECGGWHLTFGRWEA